MGLFGKEKQKDPKESVREWSRQIRREERKLERQIMAIQREENKVKLEMKKAAKTNNKEVLSVLAKEIVQSRKAVNRIYTAKAQMNSVDMNMKHQISQLRVAGALEKSTEVMKSMQALIKLPEINETMRELSKEMMKAGIIEEMMEDAMEGLDDQEELEDAAQEEVDKVLAEIIGGELVKAPHVNDSLPVNQEAAPAVEDDEEVEDMQARLEALRS